MYIYVGIHTHSDVINQDNNKCIDYEFVHRVTAVFRTCKHV